MDTIISDKELIKRAHDAMRFSYSPYSHFKVGAALLTRSGKVYLGCNIENSSFGATNCAERTAIFKAVSDGETDFEAMAICSVNKEETYPCGICLQVMSEFFDKDTRIILECNDEIKLYFLKDLLGHAFILK